MASPIVDVHCHVFNADDLPVRGFVQRLHLTTPVLGPMLATLVDRIVQGGAPSYASDKARLDRLIGQADASTAGEAEVLGPRPSAATAEDASAQLDARFEREVDDALDELVTSDPAYVRRLRAALDAETSTESSGTAEELAPEGWTDTLSTTRRAVAWAKLFAMSRPDIAARLATTYPEVELFCPLLVDLGRGLGDAAKTTVRQQVELLERISRLSMQGRLPGVTARLHPFVGFDPRRQIRARAARQDESPLDVVRWAVMTQGFVGVKVYPPMGFQPLGNTATVDMTAGEAARLDDDLREFYGWCETEQVPVTAHGNRSNHAHPSFIDFAGAAGWARVLKEFPALRLNLGHFGGAAKTTRPSGWPRAMAKLALQRDAVYADTGNHRIDDSDIAKGYLDLLAQLAGDPATDMRRRLMYGSDWFMLAVLPKHEDFLKAYRKLYRSRFTASETNAFMGGNAVRFLGFDDAGNRNAVRLRARYQQHAADRVPAWLRG